MTETKKYTNPETILTLIKLFTELEEILDNNSICILNVGKLALLNILKPIS